MYNVQNCTQPTFYIFIIVCFLETRFATYNVGLLQNVANLSLLEAKFPPSHSALKLKMSAPVKLPRNIKAIKNENPRYKHHKCTINGAKALQYVLRRALD